MADRDAKPIRRGGAHSKISQSSSSTAHDTIPIHDGAGALAGHAAGFYLFSIYTTAIRSRKKYARCKWKEKQKSATCASKMPSMMLEAKEFGRSQS